MHDQFLEVLTSVVEEIETPEVKQIYKDKGSYRDIVEIYGILAANSIFTQGDEGLALSSTIKNITTWLNHADTINKANEYPALVSGFFQILRGQFLRLQLSRCSNTDIHSGQLDSADVYFKRIKQRKYLYGASVGLVRSL